MSDQEAPMTHRLPSAPQPRQGKAQVYYSITADQVANVLRNTESPDPATSPTPRSPT